MGHDELSLLLKDQYGIAGSISQLQGEVDLNYFVNSTDNQSYILKISATDTLITSLTFQHVLLKYLKEHAQHIQVPSIINTLSGKDILPLVANGQERFVRVLDWIPGRVWASVTPHSPELLEGLGKICGEMSLALRFFDHPGAHRYIKWDPAQTRWVEPYLDIFRDDHKKSLARYYYHIFQERALPVLSSLRQSVNHNDANDYNILVSEHKENPSVLGLVDYGDAVYTYTINELAIAIAYAAMHKPDPLEAASHVVKGYHRIFPLEEDEIQVLFAMVCARLLISITASAINIEEHPENQYLQISDQSAWELLEKFRDIPYEFAHYTFRYACGWEPCWYVNNFKEWAKNHPVTLRDLVGEVASEKSIQHIDLSVGSKTLGNFYNYLDDQQFIKLITSIAEEYPDNILVGGYGEMRPFYTTDHYEVTGNQGPEWRTVHLGTDIWLPERTLILAPIHGIIHSVKDNVGERNYGPTLILEHGIDDEHTFYTLYGHLDRESLKRWSKGAYVNKGDEIAKIGSYDENGSWPPHLHIQIILNMIGHEEDFPGVSTPLQERIWKSICPDPCLLFEDFHLPDSTPPGNEVIIRQRKEKLGRNLSISYKKPLHIVRGQMQYLLDITGRRYLDMVNNVAHVGHEHPRVVWAAQQQIALLNTNTRYLHEELVAYADELLATFPPELEVCFLVNSGSEANELALRMAKTFTGEQDMIALKIGYHGNTGATIDVSSYKFDGKGGQGAPPQTHIVPMPDIFRGMFNNPDTAGKEYAQYIKTSIDQIHQQGRGVSGFICESILSCGGQIVLPKDYLTHAYQYVREAGGVCIADEVQVGFGRVGEKFWGYELQGVIPDIVTMGKPIANGHPMGAVVTTREIADAFANGMEYFNTFGGNPVSCAIGREVLTVIKEEALKENALKVGSYLQRGLRELRKQYPIIGDVRGHGLFLGFELVDKYLQPLAKEAAYLANRMRENGILMSTDGPDYNVLKIKPPMCVTEEDMNFVLEIMEKVLKEDVMSK